MNLERWYHLDKLKWEEITDGKVQGNLGTMSHTVQLKHVVFKVRCPEKLRFTLHIHMMCFRLFSVRNGWEHRRFSIKRSLIGTVL